MPPLVPIIIGAALAASGVGGIILGGLTALTIGITGLGASLILGGLSRLLLPKFPGISEFTAEARGRTITGRQVVSPWRVIYGKIRVGGVMTFLHVTGTNKEFLHIVITISGHEVEEIGLMYFDGVLVPVDGSGNATGKFLNHVHIEKNLGTDTQAAFPGLLADAPTKWTANHRQLGRAGVYVRLKFNPDKFPGQIPNITFDVKGKKVFDPRTSTTVFSENAALCFSDYLLDTDYGVGVPQSKIDNSTWIAAANLCEEQVALAAGGNEDRYTCNGSFLVSERPVDIMLALLTAMGGIAVYSGGFWFIYGAAFRSPALTFDEGDLRGPLRVQTRTARRDLFNAVKGLYVSAANNWQPSDFPPVTNATFEAEDGGKRIFTDIELPYTISAATAQRLAKIELERSRRHKIVEVRFGPTALQAQPPDVIQLSVARFGWSSKTFEVVAERLMLEQDEGGTPRPEIGLTLRETDSTVYDWAAEEAAPSAPGTPDLPDTSVATPPTGLVLSSFSITRTDGIRLTFLKAAWTAPADEFVTAGGMIEIQYKKNASGTWLPVSPVPGNETEKLIPNVDDDVAYDVRIRSVNVALAKSAFVQQLNFTVTGIAASILFEDRFVENSGFEQGDKRWAKGAGWAIVNDPPNAFKGNWAATHTTTSLGTLRNLARIPVAPGDRVLVVGYGKRTAGGGSVRVRISWRNSVDSQLSVSTGNFLSSSTYAESRKLGIAPANSVAAVLEFEVNGPDAASIFFVDFSAAGLMPIVVEGVANASYRPLTNPLTATDAGATATANIAAHTMRFFGNPQKDVSNNSGSIASLSFNTRYFIHYQDDDLSGGAQTYLATTTRESASGLFVGSIRTPVDGGTDTRGFNDGGVGAQIGMDIDIRPGTDTISGSSGYTNPLNAYDLDTSTKAIAARVSIGSNVQHDFTNLPGFPGLPSSLRLVVRSEVKHTGAGGVVTLQFSTNAGASFTNFYSVSAARALQDDSVVLGATQNIGSVQVRGILNVPTSGTLTSDIYDIRLEAKS